MKHFKLLLATMLLVSGSAALSACAGGPHGGGKGGDPKLEAARQECAEKAGEDSDGRLDFAAMDSCMEAKGYSKPEGEAGGPRP